MTDDPGDEEHPISMQQREMVQRLHEEGYTAEQIARLIRKSTAEVRSLIHRADNSDGDTHSDAA